MLSPPFVAECAKGIYRPRQHRKTAFHRLVERHYEEFERVYPEKYAAAYGHFRPVIAEVVRNYLVCGDLGQGFARVRCADCGHEYLLAFSCKGRYFCTSCHTKRAVAFSEWLNETVLWPGPHRQIVLTVPKMLRIYFRYDRRLLGKLCRVASRVITKSFRAPSGREDLEVGMVACVQTFGSFANFHPHLHILVTDGGFAADGTFYVLPKVSLAGLEQLFRHRVLKMMLREGLIDRKRVRLLLSWRHSGFNVDGSVRIRAGDAKGRENISRYLIRAPFSVGKITWAPGRTVIYRTKMVKGPNRNFQVYDPLDFLAAVTAHIPDRGEHLVRYYGWYSSVRRGRRRKLGLEEPAACVPAIEDDSLSGKEARRCWSRLIRKIYEVDPLLCPECGGLMKIIAFIEEAAVIRKILEHLRLWEEPEPRAPPPLPAQMDIEYLPFLDG